MKIKTVKLRIGIASIKLKTKVGAAVAALKIKTVKLRIGIIRNKVKEKVGIPMFPTKPRYRLESKNSS